MASIPATPRYICRRCIHQFSRQHSTLLTRPISQLVSTETVQDASSNISEGASRLRTQKHWDADFQGKLRLTRSSRSALHVGANGESPMVIVSETRPRGRIRQGRQRREEVMTRVSATSLEPPRHSGGDMRRSPKELKTEEPIQRLQPSEPSAPLSSVPKPEPTPEISYGHKKSQQSNLKDFNWYWESFPPTFTDKTQANHFFINHGKNAKLLRSVAQFRLFPESDVPEVAFVGRSNVGKSSLLNAVVNADIKSLLARTSSTPGFTKTMNLYGLGAGNGVTIKKQPDGRDRVVGRGGLTIVDMPGYGEGSLSSWGVEIMKYIQSRKQLRRVFVLLDAQHGIKDKDRSLLASLRLAGVSHQIILSKLDKLYIPNAKEIKHYNGKPMDKLKPKGTKEGLRKAMEKLKLEIKPPTGGGALGEILGCSAETMVDGKRLGVDHVRYAVLKAAGLDELFKKPNK